MQSSYKRVLFAVMLTLSVTAQSQQPTEKRYESGALQIQYSYNRSGKLHGITKEYYETGELKTEEHYKMGNLIAKKEFRRDGKPVYEMKLEDGKRQETQLQYYTTGELFRERALIDGLRHGLEIDYYRDGAKKAERNYINGKKEGSAKGFHNNGKVQGDWIFENGEPVLATIFYRNGQQWLLHTDFDDKGRLNGVTKEYDKQGSLMAVRYYNNNDMIKRVRVSSWLGWWFVFGEKTKRLIIVAVVISMVITIIVFAVRLRAH